MVINPVVILVVKYLAYALIGWAVFEKIMDVRFRSKYPIPILLIENRGGQPIFKMARCRRFASKEGEPKYDIMAGLRKKIGTEPAFNYEQTYPTIEYGPFREKFTTSILAYSPKEKNIKPIKFNMPFLKWFDHKTGKDTTTKPVLTPDEEKIVPITEIKIPPNLTILDENDRLWVIRETIKAIRFKWQLSKHPQLMLWGGLLATALAICFVLYGGVYWAREMATIGCDGAKAAAAGSGIKNIIPF